VNRTLRNVVAVLVLTAFTAIAVVATVQATGRIAGTDTAAAAPATVGQTTTQSGTTGSAQSPGQSSGAQSSGSGQQSSGQQSQATGPYGYPQSVFTPDANGLMYCPRTGCSSSSCHALQ
jgi:hypothetical protein